MLMTGFPQYFPLIESEEHSHRQRGWGFLPDVALEPPMQIYNILPISMIEYNA